MNRFDRPNPAPAPDNPTLWDEAPEFAPTPTADSIEEAFDLFHAANPWVYTALVRLARDMRSRGRQRVGMKMLFEVLRWQWYRGTIDVASEFRLNNNYTSRFARLIAEREPDLADVFEMRKLTSA
jgi:hypothetical protein